MKRRLFDRPSEQIALVAVLVLLAVFAVPMSGQIHASNLFPAIRAASNSSELPKVVKIVTFVPLPGQAATRMYTQDEYGRTYLYVEHGAQSLTVVDITKKCYPQMVDHKPGSVELARYEQLWGGGSIQASPLFTVSKGFDNQGARGMLSTLESCNLQDAKLLRAFGANYANLVDRDRRLVFFASPRYLFVVQDSRLTTLDLLNN